jgi:hypothetical protein
MDGERAERAAAGEEGAPDAAGFPCGCVGPRAGGGAPCQHRERAGRPPPAVRRAQRRRLSPPPRCVRRPACNWLPTPLRTCPPPRPGQLDFSILVEAVEELAELADGLAPALAAAASAPGSGAAPQPAAAPLAALAGAAAGEDAEGADELATLRADNERLEADRREMGLRLGEYRATVAKVGAVGGALGGGRRQRAAAEGGM